MLVNAVPFTLKLLKPFRLCQGGSENPKSKALTIQEIEAKFVFNRSILLIIGSLSHCDCGWYENSKLFKLQLAVRPKNNTRGTTENITFSRVYSFQRLSMEPYKRHVSVVSLVFTTQQRDCHLKTASEQRLIINRLTTNRVCSLHCTKPMCGHRVTNGDKSVDGQ
jgi:hypothetical protein